MQVALIQHDIAWQDGAETTRRLAPSMAQAATGGARLIVLSEMFATGFSMRPELVAEPPGGPIEQWLISQARAHNVYVLASIAQLDPQSSAEPDKRAVNVAVLAAPDGTTSRYEKMHPFSFAGEHEHYRAGDKPLTVDIDGVRTSIFICYDLRFADDFWLLAHDTDCYVVVANWPAPRHEHWRVLLQARAIENQAYVIGVNRVGLAKDLLHLGGSVVIDPWGTRVVEGGADEEILSAEVDPRRVAQIRVEFPFLADRTVLNAPPQTIEKGFGATVVTF